MTKHEGQARESSAASEPFSALAFGNGLVVDALRLIGENCAKSCAAWHEEISRFGADRITKDSKFGQSMAECRNWIDISKLQQEWATAAAQDYADAAVRFAELATKLTQDNMAAWMATNGATPQPKARQ